MAVAERTGTRKRLFYGWWIVLAATVGWGLNSGLYFYGFGAYFLSLQKAFDVGRTAISGVISLARLEGGLLGPVEGYLVDRFGPRRIMLIGLALHGAGFILLSRVNSLTQFYVVFVLMVALGAALGFGQPLTAALANWFIRRRGLAIGIASSGIGIGGLLVPGLAHRRPRLADCCGGGRADGVGRGISYRPGDATPSRAVRRAS